MPESLHQPLVTENPRGCDDVVTQLLMCVIHDRLIRYGLANSNEVYRMILIQRTLILQ